jgi:two-component system phosphate regulon response regulator PhoB
MDEFGPSDISSAPGSINVERLRILFVEDDLSLRGSLAYILGKEGFSVEAVGSGEEALAAASRRRPDLLLLDLGLPGIDGYDVCRSLQGAAGAEAVPVIMLTGRGLTEDIERGLKEYADDYIVKPCDPRLLLARIRAVLRRSGRPDLGPEDVVSFRGLRLDLAAREVLVAGRKVHLTRTEFDILALLTARPNRVFSRDRIIDRVRGEDRVVTERTVDFQICGLRQKLGAEGCRIETVRGLGYKYCP